MGTTIVWIQCDRCGISADGASHMDEGEEEHAPRHQNQGCAPARLVLLEYFHKDAHWLISTSCY